MNLDDLINRAHSVGLLIRSTERPHRYELIDHADRVWPYKYTLSELSGAIQVVEMMTDQKLELFHGRVVTKESV